MENNNGKFRITLTGWKAYVAAGVAGAIVSLAIVGACVIGGKAVKSFE